MADPELTRTQELVLLIMYYMDPVPLKMEHVTGIYEALMDHFKNDEEEARLWLGRRCEAIKKLKQKD